MDSSKQASLRHGGVSLSNGLLLAVAFFLPMVESCAEVELSAAELTMFCPLFALVLLAGLAGIGAGIGLLGRARWSARALWAQLTLSLSAVTFLATSAFAYLLEDPRTLLYGYWLSMICGVIGTVHGHIALGRLFSVNQPKRRKVSLVVAAIGAALGAAFMLLP